tara:strand:- start:529 stop:1050 length:522 start_codon:yes stop_codon:yes gene_type:complete
MPINRITFLQFSKFIFFKKSRSKLFKFLNNFDIIHCHSIWSVKIAMIAHYCNSLGIKVIFSSHGYLDDWSMKHSIIKKKLFSFFILNKIIKRSKIFFSNIGEFNESSKKIEFGDAFVIPNGIDISTYNKKKIQIKNKKKLFFLGEFMKRRESKYYYMQSVKFQKNFLKHSKSR